MCLCVCGGGLMKGSVIQVWEVTDHEDSIKLKAFTSVKGCEPDGVRFGVQAIG